MKVISIIIATYNAEENIAECINSILPQKNEKIELLFIDGMSTDKTLEIISKNKADVDFLLSEPDNGIYDAWNKGIDNAKGEWIMFLGSDDRLAPNAIDIYLKELECLKPNDINYICAKNNYIDSENNLIKIIGTEYNWNRLKRKMDIAHVGSLHSKKLFKNIGKYNLNYKICSDYELLLKGRKQINAHFIDKVVAEMKTGGVSFTVLALKESYQIRRKYSNLFILENECLFCYQLLLFFRFKFKLMIEQKLKRRKTGR